MLTMNADSFSLEDIVHIGDTFHTMKSSLYRNRAKARPKLPKCRENICLDFPRTITLETKKNVSSYCFCIYLQSKMRLKTLTA